MVPPTDAEHSVVEACSEHGDVVRAVLHGRLESSAAPLLILDGIGCSGWAFQRVIPELTGSHPVVVMHYRGHGHSPPPPRPWTFGIPDLADDAAILLQTLNIPHAVVIGFSMGFQVALELARRHSDRVDALISIAGPSGRALAQFQGTSAFAHLVPLVRATSQIAPQTSRDLWRKALSSPLSRLIGLHTQVNAQRISEPEFDYYLQQMAEMDPELFLTLLEEAHRHCADDMLPQLCRPTLVIAGGQDRFVPLPTMRAMAFAIPQAEWVVLPEASHALPAEYPETLAQRILEFVKQHGEPP